jgi:hypothetical protein
MAVSPFRLFARPAPLPEPANTYDADLDDLGGTWAPRPWGTDPAPATRHARPIAFGQPPRAGFDDRPTDPHGFPPLRAGEPPAPVVPRLDPLDAAALAGAFAADYLSWDEDDPARRGRALAEHLAGPVGDLTRLGWDGRGRQRVELVLPGPVRPDGDDRVLVDVRVRVTPYRAAADRPAEAGAEERAQGADAEVEAPCVPAAAPAPASPGWEGRAAHWVRLVVPVVPQGERAAVDAGEQFADASAPASAAVPDVPPTRPDLPREAW